MGTVIQVSLIALCVLGAAALLVLLTAYICFRKVFYSTNRDKHGHGEEYPLPDGAVYEPHHAQMIEWIKQTSIMPAHRSSF